MPKLLVFEDEKLGIDAQSLVTGRSCVIGCAGSGKSYLIGVIAEELCKQRIGFCIVDTEGEYSGLKERYDLLWVGSAKECDLNIEEVSLEKLVWVVVERSFPTILDISEVIQPERYLKAFCKALYKAESRLKIPFLLIIEEADKFAPQKGKVIKEIEEISRRGRKRGIGMMISTQRPALVNKNVLSQCSFQFIGKLVVDADLEAVNLFFPRKAETRKLTQLKKGEFYLIGIFKRRKKARVRQRETPHRGATPELVEKPSAKLAEVLQEISERELVEIAKKGRKFAYPARIEREEALEIAEKLRRKKFWIFGREEKVTGLRRIWHPLIAVKLKRISKNFWGKKEIAISSFLLDGRNAMLVELKGGLRRSNAFEGLIGLRMDEARVFLEILKKDRQTSFDLTKKTKLSLETTRKILANLEKRKLITAVEKLRKANLYSALVRAKIPSLDLRSEYEEPGEMIISGNILKPKFSEEDLREVIKALDPRSEIVLFKVFYYPIYEIEFASDEKYRILQLDGLTGRSLE
jgi:predicted protein tyrosine phosphatase